MIFVGVKDLEFIVEIVRDYGLSLNRVDNNKMPEDNRQMMKEVPFYLLCATSADNVREQALESGAIGYITRYPESEYIGQPDLIKK